MPDYFNYKNFGNFSPREQAGWECGKIADRIANRYHGAYNRNGNYTNLGIFATLYDLCMETAFPMAWPEYTGYMNGNYTKAVNACEAKARKWVEENLPRLSWSVVAVDPEDHVSVTQWELHGLYECEKERVKWWFNMGYPKTIIADLEDREEPFYDPDKGEYILSIDRLLDGLPS